MSFLESAPLTSIITKFKATVSGTNMLTRAPWPNGQYYRLRKYNITTQSDLTSGGAIWKFWDQDLSSTTTAGIGSAGAALLMVSPAPTVSGISAQASGFNVVSVTNGFNETPRVPFYAGVTVQTNVVSNITLELEIV